jgi:hypothetical protein
MRIALFVFLLLAISPAQGQNQITYQGSLTQSGQPVNGTRTLGFRLFDDLTQGSPVEFLGESQLDVLNGLFTAILDTTSDFRQDLYLEIYVLDQGQPEVLSPRTRITAAPKAIYSLNTRGLYVTPLGQVGVNEREPTAQLEVQADAGLGRSLRLKNEEHDTELDFIGDSSIYDLQVRDSALDRPLNLGLNRGGGSVVVGQPGIRFDDGSVVNSARAPRVVGLVGQSTVVVPEQTVSAGGRRFVASGIPGVEVNDIVIVSSDDVRNPFVLTPATGGGAWITFINNGGFPTQRQLNQATVYFTILRP